MTDMCQQKMTQIKLCGIGDMSIVKNCNKYWSTPEVISYKTITEKRFSDFKKLQYINILSHDLSLLGLL